MTSPKSPDELARAIETLVTDYINESRQAATKALQQAFASGRAPTAARGPAAGSATRRSSAPRRSAEEMARVAEQLYELVCAQPGESMMRFAEQTGLRTRDLHRPMSKLKAEGRVRSVGQRHLTRYFPSVGRRSRDS